MVVHEFILATLLVTGSDWTPGATEIRAPSPDDRAPAAVNPSDSRDRATKQASGRSSSPTSGRDMPAVALPSRPVTTTGALLLLPESSMAAPSASVTPPVRISPKHVEAKPL